MGNYLRLGVFSGDPRGVVHVRVQQRSAAPGEFVGGGKTKWEISLQFTAGEISQAEAARKWQVDVSTVIGIRPRQWGISVSAIKPGRPGRQQDWQLEAARAEIAQLTTAVKS